MGFNRPSKIQENALPMMLAEPYVHILYSLPVQEGFERYFVLLLSSGWEGGDGVAVWAVMKGFQCRGVSVAPWICPFPGAGTEHAMP